MEIQAQYKDFHNHFTKFILFSIYYKRNPDHIIVKIKQIKLSEQ